MPALESAATVLEVIARTPSVRSVRVKPEFWQPFKAGQWLLVTLGSQKGMSKPLSICNAPSEAGYLEFSKKNTGSDFSKALFCLKSGDTIRIKYPNGQFCYDPEALKIAFLSGGIGITPIRSICRDIVDRKLGTDIVLFYGNNSIEEIAYRQDLEAMQKAHGAFKIVHVLRQAPGGWTGATGFVTEALVRQEMPDYDRRKFYLCGPPPMVEALKKMLAESLGVSNDRIVIEGFAGYN